jgi:hypothetical protein
LEFTEFQVGRLVALVDQVFNGMRLQGCFEMLLVKIPSRLVLELLVCLGIDLDVLLPLKQVIVLVMAADRSIRNNLLVRRVHGYAEQVVLLVSEFSNIHKSLGSSTLMVTES